MVACLVDDLTLAPPPARHASLHLTGASVLATGAWFESTPCRVISTQVWQADSGGDLSDADACRRFDLACSQLLALRGEPPRAIAHDLHPDFHSSRRAQALAAQLGVPALAVQHHHAHIAAVLAEHACSAEVIGLAVDGIGLGSDGGAWGGELLRVRGAESVRVGHLATLPLPGGDRAAREPWRMAAAALHMLGRGDEIATRFAHHPAAGQLRQVIDHPRLSPPSSSLGRHFDAAAALLGLCEINRTGPEAAIALQRAADAHGPTAPRPGDWRIEPDGRLNLLPLLAALADETEPACGAARFHHSLAAGLAEWVVQAAHACACTTVALGGGCLHNRILVCALEQQLQLQRLTVLRPLQLSPGDASLAVGQAWVAQRLLEQGT